MTRFGEPSSTGTQQTERRYCRHCRKDVRITSGTSPGDRLDPFVVVGTLGIALLLQKLGISDRSEPPRCPDCGNPVDGVRVEGERVSWSRPRMSAQRTAAAQRGVRDKPVRHYIAELEELAAKDGGIADEYNLRVRQGIRLYYSPQVTAQIDKLVSAGNVDRALKLLAAVRPYRWPRAQRFAKVLAVPVVMDLVAIGLLTVGVVSMRRAEASREWPTAEGTVLESGIDTIRGDDGTSYRTRVCYRYFTGGIAYVGDRLAFGSGGIDLPSANETLSKYAVGAPVTVFYDPANHAESVLEPGAHMSSIVFIVVAIVMFMSSAVSMFVLIRKPMAELRAIEGHPRE